MVKICKDGRIWGQNNKEALSHLGVLKTKKIWVHNPNSKGKPFKKGFIPWNAGTGRPRDYNKTFNIEFKDLIRKRDNFQCQICGCPEKECLRKLDIHHIDYNKKNDNPSNLISLCIGCHTRTTHKRNHWKNLLEKKSLQNEREEIHGR